MPVLLATLLALTPVTAPRPMPGDICIEVLWELAHTEVLSEAERQHLIENIELVLRHFSAGLQPEGDDDFRGGLDTLRRMLRILQER